MINLIKKLQIISIILIINSSAFALTSSSFLISQSAYENYDYSSSLLNFDIDEVNLSEDSLLDKAIAAIITEDIDLASKIAKNILTEDKNNAEALIITAASFYKEEKFNKIIELRKNLEQPSEVLEFIFFSNNTLKDIDTISRALVEIVSSSYSNNEQRRINYNFLLFYISLAKIIDPENDRAIIIKAELFDQVGQHQVAVDIYKQVNKNNIFYLDAQNNLARHYLFNSPYEEAEIQIRSIVEKNNNTYGLINIPKFYIDFDNQSNRDAAKDLRTEIERLKEQGIQGLVIDLRNNGGGALKTVVEMAGMFIKNGPVVQVKYFDKEKQVLSDRDRSVLWTGPLVILVNEGSASASEILAAAMQDYKRAIIIGGNQTWGKGTVQNVFPLNRMVRGNTNGDLGALRYTTQKYYRINGGSVQLEGVKSDINVPYRYKYLEFGDNPGWGWSSSAALSLLGTYAMFAYLAPLAGGWLGDKKIGYRNAVVIGALLMTFGHASMAVETPTFLYIGISLLVIGTGFFKPNITSIISKIYEGRDDKATGEAHNSPIV